MAALARIKALQQKLSETYSKPSATRLTERNIADLVLQLVQDGDLQVIFSEDGLEYLTPKQLLKEIEYEVALQGGRLSIFGLASTLGVNDIHVDRQLQNIAAGDHASLFFISESNELLNEEYNLRLIAKLSIQLDSTGTAKISDFASKNALPFKYVDNLVKNALASGSLVAEKDEEGISLFKADYLEKFTTLLRSALAASTRPVVISKLLAQHPNIYAPSSIVSKAIESLSTGLNAVSGTFETKKGIVTFYPNIFVEARKEWIQTTLKRDLIVPLKVLEKLDVAPTNSSVLGSDTFVLSQSVISSVLVEQLASLLSECVQENGIVPLMAPNVPEGMSKVDLKSTLALERLSSSISLGRVVNEAHFVANGFVDRCLKLYQQKFADEARALAPAETSEGHIILSTSGQLHPPSTRPIPSPSASITRGSVFEQIKAWCPNQRKYETALSFLAEDLLPQIQSMAHATPALSSSTGIDRRVENLENDEWWQKFQPSGLNLIFFLKAVEKLPTAISPEQRQPLYQHTMESVGTPVLKQLIIACNRKYMLGEAREDILEGLKLFPAETSKPLLTLHKLTSGAERATKKPVAKAIDAVLSVLGYPALHLDPDTQNKILRTHRASALAQLQAQPPAEPSTRLRLALSLMQAKLSGFILLTTTRHLQMIVHSIKSDLFARGDFPVFGSMPNSDVASKVDASYAALLATIRAKQSKNADQLREALDAFEEKFTPLLECSS